jgi:hypothetical protein
VSGPPLAGWSRFDPGEELPKLRIPPIFDSYQNVKVYQVRTKNIRKVLKFGHVTIPNRTVIAVDAQEKAALAKMGLIEPVDTSSAL